MVFAAAVNWKSSLHSPLFVYEKAKIFSRKIDDLSEFKANHAWLRNFKTRHGIRQLDLSGERLSAHNNAADKFTEHFKT